MIPALTPRQYWQRLVPPRHAGRQSGHCDTTAVRLNVMGEKTHDAGRAKSKMSVTASPLLSLLALVQESFVS